jgi:diaminopropionate ammonia-lyase
VGDQLIDDGHGAEAYAQRHRSFSHTRCAEERIACGHGRRPHALRRSVVNRDADPAAVPAPSRAAAAFHAALDGFAPTPLHECSDLAAELGLGRVALKDESARLGLPAFKVLGASWAIECALAPGVHTLVAASAGNHGRAVAHEAARRGLAARIHLPARSSPARRAAIAAEGAELVVADGPYELAVARAAADGARPGHLEIADVGASEPALRVIDGYATLFAELPDDLDLLLVPAGVGSLAAAAARHGAASATRVIAVEPAAAACVGASLAAGRPVAVDTPGTSMAGLDCAEVSAGAWPSLHAGLHGAIAVSDAEAHAAMRELAARGLAIGDCGAAALAALRALATEPDCAALRDVVGLGPASRVGLIATEGPSDPAAYATVTAGDPALNRGRPRR